MAAGLGELAAFGTASTWAISNQIQSAVGQKIGGSGVTLLRMPYQMALLALMCFMAQTDTGMGFRAFILIFLSGVTGLCVCDLLLYRAIFIIGPPMAVLVISTSSAFTALISWIFLGETLPLQAVIGIIITLLGIVFVITERSGSTLLPGQVIPSGKMLYFGVGMTLGAAFMMAVSFILLKAGMREGVTPLWATFIRVAVAAPILWGLGLTTGWTASAVHGVKTHPKIIWMLLISCVCGSIGMWLSSVALDRAPAGVAATLIGLQPILVTFVGAVWYHRKPSFRVLAGSAVAFIGTALLCL